ncbi:hypothetical protein Brsp01_03790 [Brucella sp. NBRC 12950]|nr:hypothetical protein Brsp01_03790 [Brucella sp. NBRC 12950]
MSKIAFFKIGETHMGDLISRNQAGTGFRFVRLINPDKLIKQPGRRAGADIEICRTFTPEDRQIADKQRSFARTCTRILHIDWQRHFAFTNDEQRRWFHDC